MINLKFLYFIMVIICFFSKKPRGNFRLYLWKQREKGITMCTSEVRERNTKKQSQCLLLSELSCKIILLFELEFD